MKVVFVSNFFTHLQKPISDELYKRTNGNYHFISTAQLTAERKSLGFESLQPTYLIEYNSDTKLKIDLLILEADIVIIGAAPLSLIKERLRLNKLTFRYSERLFKTRSRYLKWPIHFINSFKTRKCYFLCSGAYAAKDFMNTGFFHDKCFKWGYFPKVKVYGDIDDIVTNKTAQKDRIVSIIWVARMLRLKHPEYAISVAERLVSEGINFRLHMIGNGVLEQEIRDTVVQKGLSDNVVVHGSMKPDQVREYMERSDIFIFTSDRQEGWGAVVNEAMNSACAVVASHSAGVTPFLVENNVNGYIFKSGDVNDLYSKVKDLISDDDKRKKFAIQAYETMTSKWSTENIVGNLLTLAKCLQNTQDTSSIKGPCEKALYLPENWIDTQD